MNLIILFFNLMLLSPLCIFAMEQSHKQVEGIKAVHFSKDLTGRRRSNSVSDMDQLKRNMNQPKKNLLHTPEYLAKIKDFKANPQSYKNSNISKSQSDLSETEKKQISEDLRSNKLASYAASSFSQSASELSNVEVELPQAEVESSKIISNAIENTQIILNKIDDIHELGNALKQYNMEQIQTILKRDPNLLNVATGKVFKRAIILQFMAKLCGKKHDTMQKLWSEIILHADKVDKELSEKMLAMIKKSISKCPKKNFNETVRLKLIKKDIKLHFIKDPKTVERKKRVERSQNEDELCKLKRSFYGYLHDENCGVAIDNKLKSFKIELKHIKENSTDSLTKKQGVLASHNESQLQMQKQFEKFEKDGFKLLLWPIFFKDIVNDNLPPHIIDWLKTNLDSNEYKQARHALSAENSSDSKVQESLALDKKWRTLLHNK